MARERGKKTEDAAASAGKTKRTSASATPKKASAKRTTGAEATTAKPNGSGTDPTTNGTKPKRSAVPSVSARASSGSVANATPARKVKGGQEPTYDQIRRRAHEIYLNRGGEAGDATSDWFQAERELCQLMAGQVTVKA